MPNAALATIVGLVCIPPTTATPRQQEATSLPRSALHELAPLDTRVWVECTGLELDLEQLGDVAASLLRGRDLVQELGRGSDPADRSRAILEVVRSSLRGPIGRDVRDLLRSEFAVGWTGGRRVFAVFRPEDPQRCSRIATRLRKLLGSAIASDSGLLVLAPKGKADSALQSVSKVHGIAQGTSLLAKHMSTQNSPVRGYVDWKQLPLPPYRKDEADVLGTLLFGVLEPLIRQGESLTFTANLDERVLRLEARLHGASRAMSQERREVLGLGKPSAPPLPRTRHTALHFATRRDFGALVRHRASIAGERCRIELGRFLSQLELSFKGMEAETEILGKLRPGLSFAVAGVAEREAGPVPGLELPSFALGIGAEKGRALGAADAAFRFLMIAGNAGRTREGKLIRRIRGRRYDERKVAIAELARPRGGRPAPIEAELVPCLALGENELWVTTRPEHVAEMHALRQGQPVPEWSGLVIDELNVDFESAAYVLDGIVPFAKKTLQLQQGVQMEVSAAVFDEARRVLPQLGQLSWIQSVHGEDLCWQLSWRFGPELLSRLEGIGR